MSNRIPPTKPITAGAPVPARKKGVNSSRIIGISLGVALVALVVFFAWRQFVPPALGPAKIRTRHMSMAPHPAGIEKLVARMPSQPGNAADDYWQIVTEYDKNPNTFENFINLSDEQCNAATLIPNQPFAALRAGVLKKDCTLYFGKTGPFNLFSREAWQTAMFEKTAEMIYNAVDVYRAQGDVAAERALWETYLLFGRHICRHRVRTLSFYQGVQAQLNAVDNLIQLYKKAKQAEKVKTANEYKSGLQAMADAWQEKFEIIKRLNVHIGDLVHVIENDPDRMWRIEAILMLSFRRHTVGNTLGHYQVKVEQDRARKLLARLANDSDPYIAAAAKVAGDLKKEQVGNVEPAF